MKQMRFLLLALLPLLLSSCLPISSQPLTPQADSKPDARLEGVWLGMVGDEKTPVYIHFIRHDATMFGIWIEMDRGRPDPKSYEVFPSVITGKNYLNVRPSDPPGEGEPQGWFFVRYEFNKEGGLHLLLINNEEAAKLVREGKLKGEVKESQYAPEVRITAEAKDLSEFIASPAAANLFSTEMGLFQRTSVPAK